MSISGTIFPEQFKKNIYLFEFEHFSICDILFKISCEKDLMMEFEIY